MYPSNISMPPKLGEYVYFSNRINNFSGNLFKCVRPRWIVKVKHQKRDFFVHFSSKYILDDIHNCVCIGTCTKVVSKLNLIELKKNL
jgi:hypothetical protein